MTAIRIVQVGLHALPDTLFVIDGERRTYLGLSRDGTYWHVVAPAQVDVETEAGEILRPAGELACTCRGGTFHGHCYWLEQAVAHEAGRADQAVAPKWLREPMRGLDNPAGAGESVEAARG